MSVLVYLSGTARDHFVEIDDAWRSNNPSRPELFCQELGLALQKIASFPNSGLAHQDRPGVRQTLLRKTGYYVYYRQDPSSQVVEVVAIWNTRRGAPPPLT